MHLLEAQNHRAAVCKARVSIARRTVCCSFRSMGTSCVAAITSSLPCTILDGFCTLGCLLRPTSILAQRRIRISEENSYFA